jgi:hypothetical protein
MTGFLVVDMARRPRKGRKLIKGYRISLEKKLILSGEQKKLKRRNRFPTERRKSCNSRIQS